MEKINSFLPPEIRVFGIEKTLKSFHAKNRADYRICRYLLPTWIFDSKNDQGKRDKSFQFTSDILIKLNNLLSIFKGNHNFKNFSVKKLSLDRSMYRYIHSISVSKEKKRLIDKILNCFFFF